LSIEGNPAAESVLRIINSKDVLIAAARVLTPASTFLRLEGANNEGITVDGGDLRKAANMVDFADGAKPDAVKLRV
jgi:hypothetical protein